MYLIFLSRSPDFNALDLGAWRSLASGIPSLKGKDKSGRLIDRIVLHVLERWNLWDAIHRLDNIFNTKSRIMKAVSLVQGSNEYEIPRSECSHSKEKATYIPKRLHPHSEQEGEEEEEIMALDFQINEENGGSEVEVDEGSEMESDESYHDESQEEEGSEMSGSEKEKSDVEEAMQFNQTNEVLQWWSQRMDSYSK